MSNDRAEKNVFHFLSECTTLSKLRIIFLDRNKCYKVTNHDSLEQQKLPALVEYARRAWNDDYAVIKGFNFRSVCAVWSPIYSHVKTLFFHSYINYNFIFSSYCKRKNCDLVKFHDIKFSLVLWFLCSEVLCVRKSGFQK